MPKPTEKFLLVQRLFTFLDEWLFYGLLLFLYVNDYDAFWPVVAIGGLMIGLSYYKLWTMEREIFSEEPPS